MSSRVVLAGRPEPQDLRAVLRDDVVGRHGVADGLRHLAPVAVDHEAVRQHRPVRRRARACPPPRAARSGTSRGAGPSPRGTCPPASAARACCSSTAAWLQPESNQTSRMSVSFRNARAAALRARGARRAGAPRPTRSVPLVGALARLASARHVLDERAPRAGRSRRPRSRRRRSARPRRAGARCIQSGRWAIMLVMRSSPQGGIHRTVGWRRAPARAASRRAARGAWSSAMNHCSVARKSVGFLQRQQCGYVWRQRHLGDQRAALLRGCSMIRGFASQTVRPRSAPPRG